MNAPRSPLRFTHPSSEATPELRSLLESARDDDPSHGDLNAVTAGLRAFGVLPIAASSTALGVTQTAATTHAAQGVGALTASKGIFVGFTMKAVAIGVAAGVAGGTLVATVVKARPAPARHALVSAHVQAPAGETSAIASPLPIPAAPTARVATPLPTQIEPAPFTTVRRAHTHVAPLAATRTPSPAVEAEPAISSRLSEAIPVAASTTPVAPVVEVPAGPARAETKSASPAMTPELRLLQRAYEALRQNDGHQALALADEHALGFPSGLLAQEREVIAIEALMRLGRTGDAQRRADDFRKQFPGSGHLLRIDALLKSDAR